MRKLSVIIFFVLSIGFFHNLQAESINLSPYSEISVLTCSPGYPVYAAFGHSAIRVNDPYLGLDVVYNYGTFSFQTKGFYIKFLQRNLDYYLSRDYYSEFAEDYERDERGITEQVLNLTLQQKQSLFNALEENYLPENKYYRYDFFFDNCATRVRDIISQSLENEIQYDFSLMDTAITFRQIIKPFMKNNEWVHLGMSIGLGRPTDRLAKPEELMLIPEYMYNIYSKSALKKRDPLIKKTNELLKAKPQEDRSSPLLLSPLFVFWFIFALATLLSVIQIRKKNLKLYFDVVWFGLLGILGILIFFLWFFTHHGVTENNLNIIWTNPLNFILLFAFAKRGLIRKLKIYFPIISVLSLLFLIASLFNLQGIHPAFIPMILTSVIRSYTIYRLV